MDTFDSRRSTVPARLPGARPGSQALRTSAGLPASSPGMTLSLRTVVRGACRYWWLILMLWVVASTSIGIMIYLNIRPSYRALSLLRVDPVKDDIFNSRGGGDALDPFLQTQVQLITSPNVLTAAGTNPKVATLPRVQKAGDIVQELRKVVAVAVIPGTYLIEVSMTSNDGAEAAAIVNAVVGAFEEANSEWSNGMTRVQIQNLEVYDVELKNKIDELERKWKNYAAKGSLEPLSPGLSSSKKEDGNATNSKQDRTTITIEEYRLVYRQLNDVKLELAQAQALLATAKASVKKPGQNQNFGPAEEQAMIDAQVERKFNFDPDVIALKAQMSETMTKIDEARRVSNMPGDPAEQRAKRKLDELKTRWVRLWDAKSPMIREQIELGLGGEGRPLDPDRGVVEAQNTVNKLLARQAALKTQHDLLDIKNKDQATDAIEVALIMDQREMLKGMQIQVIRRLEQFRYEAKGEARIRPVNPNGAMIPTRPIGDKRTNYLMMTPIGVLGVVLGLVVLLEIRAGRVDDPEVLSSRIKHEVFSIAPLPSIRADEANSDKAEQRLARFVQSLDHLRVAICEGGSAGEGRCVMITSATGGEGKTTLSAHLAARCANSGTATLLIDADMRRASLGRLLDVPVGPGLVDVLGGEIDLDEALITVQAGGFHFLSAGSAGKDPSRVLKSTRFSELLARLRQTYDLVIIDTPPVLPVADALIMGRWVDGAVMAARFDASRLPLVERANRQLALAGIPVLGVVVNGVRGQSTAYGNYNYAYNYGYYPARTEPTADAPSA
jgi:succinoglycan biosynthesis transport protein ExoP